MIVGINKMCGTNSCLQGAYDLAIVYSIHYSKEGQLHKRDKVMLWARHTSKEHIHE